MDDRPLLLLFHRTIGAEFDARIAKILGSLEETGRVHCLAVLWERNNRPRTGRLSSGIRYEVRRLPVSSKREPRPGPLVSLVEILQEAMQAYLTMRRSRPAIVIIQNHRLFLLAGLMAVARPGYVRRVVWDLRELPTGFLAPRSLRARLFASLLCRCDAVIVTNDARLQYMKRLFGERAMARTHVIPNYVPKRFAEIRAPTLPPDITRWLRGRPFYYIQNPGSDDRYPDNTLRAILDETDKAVIITGGIPDATAARLASSYGARFDERVYISPLVGQETLAAILDAAYASIILYDSRKPNNDCCDPNRLYQAMSRGTPVIVGHNKGLGPLVSHLGIGVVLDDDGRTVDRLSAGLRTLDAEYDALRRKALLHTREFLWDNVEPRLVKAVLGED